MWYRRYACRAVGYDVDGVIKMVAVILVYSSYVRSGLDVSSDG